MSYKPPFTITTDILNLVVENSEQVGRLNDNALNASFQLRKHNRIKIITGTLAIEGNMLQSASIKDLLFAHGLSAIAQVLVKNAPINAPVNAPVNLEGLGQTKQVTGRFHRHD